MNKKLGLDPYFNIEDELLMWKGRCYILEDIDLNNMILYDNHDIKIAGHFRIYKTLEWLKYNYYWPKMEEEIKNYI